MDPTSTTSSDNVIKVTAGLIAAIPVFAEINNLRESQRLDLRMRVKYPDQNVHLVVPRMRDLKRMVTENGEGSWFTFLHFPIDIIDLFMNSNKLFTNFLFQRIIGGFEQIFCYHMVYGQKQVR